MSDEDVNVRTAVIKTLNEIVHRENTLIKPVLADMLPTLLARLRSSPNSSSHRSRRVQAHR